jgi:protein-S-isoprenylcysteine O-methyltransferase Ste14
MRTETFVVALTPFLVQGLLPWIFFRRDGKLNVRWWLTAAPWFICAACMLLAYANVVRPVDLGVNGALSLAAVVLAVAAVSLIWFTLGTHRIPVALWHQDNDTVVELVTWGAYRWIRHPFYSAFLLSLTAGLLAAPSVVTLLTLATGLTALSVTARREERRLLQSHRGAQYGAYMRSSGRFLPALGRTA